MSRSIFKAIIVKILALTTMLSLFSRKNGKVLAFNIVARSNLGKSEVLNKRSVIVLKRSFNFHNRILFMSEKEGDQIDAITKPEKAKKERKEKKEDLAPQGIEEIREVRVQKLNTIREAGMVHLC
jgi:uncharacterized protein (DUF1697 family)